MREWKCTGRGGQERCPPACSRSGMHWRACCSLGSVGGRSASAGRRGGQCHSPMKTCAALLARPATLSTAPSRWYAGDHDGELWACSRRGWCVRGGRVVAVGTCSTRQIRHTRASPERAMAARWWVGMLLAPGAAPGVEAPPARRQRRPRSLPTPQTVQRRPPARPPRRRSSRLGSCPTCSTPTSPWARAFTACPGARSGGRGGGGQCCSPSGDDGRNAASTSHTHAALPSLPSTPSLPSHTLLPTPSTPILPSKHTHRRTQVLPRRAGWPGPRGQRVCRPRRRVCNPPGRRHRLSQLDPAAAARGGGGRALGVRPRAARRAAAL